MSDKPVQLIIAAFADEAKAKTAFDGIKKNAKDVALKSAAFVFHDTEGKLHIKESHEFTATKGAGWGLAIGVVAGVLTGGAALVIGAAGAAAGALIGKGVDTGIPNDQLKHLGKVLEPGTAAVMAIVDPGAAEAVQQELQTAGGTIATTELQAKIADEIRQSQVVDASATDASTSSISQGLSSQGMGMAMKAGGETW